MKYEYSKIHSISTSNGRNGHSSIGDTFLMNKNTLGTLAYVSTLHEEEKNIKFYLNNPLILDMFLL